MHRTLRGRALSGLESPGVRESEAGQGMTEYALILTLIAILLIITVAVLGHQTSNVYSNVASVLSQ